MCPWQTIHKKTGQSFLAFSEVKALLTVFDNQSRMDALKKQSSFERDSRSLIEGRRVGCGAGS